MARRMKAPPTPDTRKPCTRCGAMHDPKDARYAQVAYDGSVWCWRHTYALPVPPAKTVYSGVRFPATTKTPEQALRWLKQREKEGRNQ